MKHVLVGKTITAIHLAADKKAIKFDVENEEPIIARTDGACCSSSWIESLDTPELLIGGQVSSVQGIPMFLEEDEWSVIKHYGCRINTNKGSCVIDYRNQSNGYYGGVLRWPEDEDYFYGGVHGQNISNEEWKQIAP